jgi:hypothetical protein
MKIQGHTILFRAIVGSHACGTNIETSDIDYKGVFIQDPEDCYINGYKDELIISKDEKYFEIGKFINMCSGGNPDALLLLYSPAHCIVWNTDEFDQIIAIKELFLTKNLRHSFGEYATAQVKKADGLDKMMNWEKEKTFRKTVEEMCSVYDFSAIQNGKMFDTNAIKYSNWLEKNGFKTENCGLSKLEHFRDAYLLFHSSEPIYKGISIGEDANDVCLSAIEKEAIPLGILYFHKDAYSTHCKKWKQYQDWLKNRNTDRYVDIEGHGQQIDGKNVLHCVRIIETAMEIPLHKTINVLRPNRDFLVGIRKGKYDLQTLIDKSEKDLEELKKLFIESDLPDKFLHREKVDALIRNIKEDNYKKSTCKWLKTCSFRS